MCISSLFVLTGHTETRQKVRTDAKKDCLQILFCRFIVVKDKSVAPDTSIMHNLSTLCFQCPQPAAAFQTQNHCAFQWLSRFTTEIETGDKSLSRLLLFPVLSSKTGAIAAFPAGKVFGNVKSFVKYSSSSPR